MCTVVYGVVVHKIITGLRAAGARLSSVFGTCSVRHGRRVAALGRRAGDRTHCRRRRPYARPNADLSTRTRHYGRVAHTPSGLADRRQSSVVAHSLVDVLWSCDALVRPSRESSRLRVVRSAGAVGVRVRIFFPLINSSPDLRARVEVLNFYNNCRRVCVCEIVSSVVLLVCVCQCECVRAVRFFHSARPTAATRAMCCTLVRAD